MRHLLVAMTEPPKPISRNTCAPCAESVSDLTFERLASAHRPRALRFAFAFLGSRDAAEDVLQEALKRLFERRQMYPLATHFGPFLIKTMAHLCVDEKRARRAHSNNEATVTAPLSRIDDPADLAEKRETAHLIAKAVARLSQRERACFLLTVCEGLSYREVAEALTLNFSDVNNAVRAARVALRDTLGPLLQRESTASAPPEGDRS